MSLDAWWRAGRHVPVRGSEGAAYELFVHESGAGPHVTLLHGYPSSSYDWHEVLRQLEGGVRALAPDLLGFGASSKPRGHAYSLHEQADLVEQLWQEAGVGSTVLVAHDYSTSIAQELLARSAGVLTGVVLLNGAVYPQLHRPTASQQLLLGPDGPALAALIDRTAFVEGMRATFGTAAPATDEQLDETWRALARQDGQQLAADLLHYVTDRTRHGERWVAALEGTPLLLSFVWGLQDPVSGAHVLHEVRRRLPRARVRALPDTGHWPALEAPAEVAGAILDLLVPGTLGGGPSRSGAAG